MHTKHTHLKETINISYCIKLSRIPDGTGGSVTRKCACQLAIRHGTGRGAVLGEQAHVPAEDATLTPGRVVALRSSCILGISLGPALNMVPQ